MALALYRKYRPRTFAEVIGQEHVTEPLSQALRSGRLNHAYLFSGPRGCGKTSSARILARSLNCERGPTPEPCGECQSCRDLAPDGAGSIDVIEIDAASHGGVDDARDLRERAFFAPVSSRFKVYVIDEAHMVSSAGFNALLKLVEEPPEYVKFVFATTEPEKVLGTIKSRTHHYPFRLIPPGVLRPYLEQLTAAEGVKVEPAVFPLVVRAGAGSARDTLSVLDQLISGAGDEGVTYTRAVALLGVTDVALIDEMCDALAADDGRGAYGVIDRVVEAGHDPRRFASDLLERLRDLIVLQQVPDAVTKGLLDAPHDQLDKMGAQATQLGQATLSRYADIVHDGLTEMRGTTAPRLLLELITARMLLPGADASSSALLQRLERMERRLQAGGVPAASEPMPAATAPTYAPAPVRGSTDGGNRGLDYIRGTATAPPRRPRPHRPSHPAPGTRRRRPRPTRRPPRRLRLPQRLQLLRWRPRRRRSRRPPRRMTRPHPPRRPRPDAVYSGAATAGRRRRPRRRRDAPRLARRPGPSQRQEQEDRRDPARRDRPGRRGRHAGARLQVRHARQHAQRRPRGPAERPAGALRRPLAGPLRGRRPAGRRWRRQPPRAPEAHTAAVRPVRRPGPGPVRRGPVRRRLGRAGRAAPGGAPAGSRRPGPGASAPCDGPDLRSRSHPLTRHCGTGRPTARGRPVGRRCDGGGGAGFAGSG
ncbi:DNA polymerase III subunit gamma and tau [Dactylosporangium darangshiense]|uniref:DNA polymerase III subunit gamma and tau n=1 Tax=Dactylosporangium darangshiense TaxID=579108 RepID=UPI0036437D44